MSVTSGARMVSSLSTYLGIPLVQSSHGTLDDTGIGANIGSSRIAASTCTRGLVGRSLGSLV